MEGEHEQEFHYIEGNWTFDGTWFNQRNKPYVRWQSIGQGTSRHQRVGRTATLKSIELRGSISLPSKDFSGSAEGDFAWDRLRIVFVINHQKNHTGARPEEVFSGIDLVTNANQLNCNNFYNPDGFERYTVIFDKTYDIAYRSSLTTEVVAGNVGHLVETLQLDLKIRYINELDEQFQNQATNAVEAYALCENGLVHWNFNWRTYFWPH